MAMGFHEDQHYLDGEIILKMNEMNSSQQGLLIDILFHFGLEDSNIEYIFDSSSLHGLSQKQKESLLEVLYKEGGFVMQEGDLLSLEDINNSNEGLNDCIKKIRNYSMIDDTSIIISVPGLKQINLRTSSFGTFDYDYSKAFNETLSILENSLGFSEDDILRALGVILMDMYQQDSLLFYTSYNRSHGGNGIKLMRDNNGRYYVFHKKGFTQGLKRSISLS